MWLTSGGNPGCEYAPSRPRELMSIGAECAAPARYSNRSASNGPTFAARLAGK
jgi:hypothetical protein